MRPMLKTVSGTALIVIAILLVLQVSPPTGAILAILGGPIWIGVWIHIFLLALAIEAWVGRIPRALVAIPLLAHGGYAHPDVEHATVVAGAVPQARGATQVNVQETTADVLPQASPPARPFAQNHPIPVAYNAN